MTFYYQTQSWSSQPQVSDETRQLWEHVAQKKNWRIVQLPNGFYQTEHQTLDEQWVDVTRRETIEGAELAFEIGPKVLKDLSKKDFPIMYSLVESICKDKKFVINFL